MLADEVVKKRGEKRKAKMSSPDVGTYPGFFEAVDSSYTAVLSWVSAL
jgi:hypothetical protein